MSQDDLHGFVARSETTCDCRSPTVYRFLLSSVREVSDGAGAMPAPFITATPFVSGLGLDHTAGLPRSRLAILIAPTLLWRCKRAPTRATLILTTMPCAVPVGVETSRKSHSGAPKRIRSIRVSGGSVAPGRSSGWTATAPSEPGRGHAGIMGSATMSRSRFPERRDRG